MGTKYLLNPRLIGAKASKLATSLLSLVIGQDQAVNTIIQMYQMQLAGLHNPTKPICNILITGPTGSGKTLLVESLAKVLHGEEEKMIKIDCAEFQHDHEIAKLTGAPPGYLGHRETVLTLTQETLNNCTSEEHNISIVLFDEIEKASSALWDLLLGILDKDH